MLGKGKGAARESRLFSFLSLRSAAPACTPRPIVRTIPGVGTWATVRYRTFISLPRFVEYLS
jgi:hypothetical protein